MRRDRARRRADRPAAAQGREEALAGRKTRLGTCQTSEASEDETRNPSNVRSVGRRDSEPVEDQTAIIRWHRVRIACRRDIVHVEARVEDQTRSSDDTTPAPPVAATSYMSTCSAVGAPARAVEGREISTANADNPKAPRPREALRSSIGAAWTHRSLVLFVAPRFVDGTSPPPSVRCRRGRAALPVRCRRVHRRRPRPRGPASRRADRRRGHDGSTTADRSLDLGDARRRR